MDLSYKIYIKRSQNELNLSKIIMKISENQEIQKEKQKRGNFTYNKLPQANFEPARESIKNAEFFFKHVNNLCS